MLEGRVALVTGGTGALGAAICRELAAAGADLGFTWGTRAGEADTLAAEIEALGRRCRHAAVPADDAAAVAAFVERLEAELGRIDVLVNNVGAAQVMPFALLEEEDWDRLVSVNVKSMFLFTKAAVRGMLRRRAGVVINIGSIAGHRMLETPVHYATTKAAVTGFTLALAREVGRWGVRVVEVAPGLIEGGVSASVPDAQRQDYARHCALGRAGTPGEVASVVAFLASDKASYLNAQTVVLDGGL